MSMCVFEAVTIIIGEISSLGLISHADCGLIT